MVGDSEDEVLNWRIARDSGVAAITRSAASSVVGSFSPAE